MRAVAPGFQSHNHGVGQRHPLPPIHFRLPVPTQRHSYMLLSEVYYCRILSSKWPLRRPLTGFVLGWFPAQDRVLALALQESVDPPRGGHLVQASDGEAVGLVVELVRLLFGLPNDLADGGRKRVQ